MRKIVIGSLLAIGMASTSAMAQSTESRGAAASNRHGSVAVGTTAQTQDRMHRHDRRNARGDQQATQEPRTPTNSASTYGAGSVYTDRYRATGAVAAGGRASGTGYQASSSSVDAYGATDRDGSTGEVYGDSSATSEPGQ
jgi:Ni/Co efflux regulator RcnB